MSRRLLAIALVVYTALLFGSLEEIAGDVVVFKDGRRFRCRILEVPEKGEEGDFRIESQGSVLRIRGEYVESYQRDDTDDEADQEAIQALLQELIDEGRIVPSMTPQIQFAPKPQTDSDNVTLQVSDVRGWAYLLHGETSGTGGRSRLAENDTVPPGYAVEVSPNSRLLLGFGSAAKLGMNAGSRLRILSVAFEKDTFVYRLEVELTAGTLWVDVLSLGELRKVKLINRGHQVFLNQQLVVSRASPGGGLEIVPLSDTISVTNANGIRVPKVSPGERWISRQDGVEVVPASEWEKDVQIWQEWDAWQPEKLQMEWNPVLPTSEPRPVFEEVAPVFPWKIPVDSSFVMTPNTRSLPEVIASLLDGIQAFRQDTGAYPSRDKWIHSLVTDPGISGWSGPYITGDLPRVDLWGRPFIYEIFRDGERTFVDVRSRGPNGEDDRGLSDDIRLGREE